MQATNDVDCERRQLVTKNRKGCGKIVCIIAIIGLILLGCVIFILLYQGKTTLSEPLSIKTPSPVTLEKIMDFTFEPVRFNGSWISDEELLMKNQYGLITIFNVTSRTSKTILRDTSLTSIASEIQLSADKKYLLIAYNMQKIYRHSSYFSALIYDIQTKKHEAISNSNNEPLVLQLFKWAPKGNGYAYVYYNNVFYRPNATTLEEYRITNNGNSSLYNGVCDWVYEEEIFSDTVALWFSPSGEKLAYASFDDSAIDIMSITYYGEPGIIDSQYPKTYNLRYPKPGRINPTVKLSVVDLKKNAVQSIEISFSQSFTETILNDVTWISNEYICVVAMNRIQNEALILKCNINNGLCEEIMHMENKKGWIIMPTAPLFSSNGNIMLFINSWDQGSNLGGYRHLTLHDVQKNITMPLTHGKYTVIEILSWDHEQNVVYYLATEENKPMNQQVYKIIISEKDPYKSECLSCINENEKCTFASTIFSKKSSYSVQTCAGPGIPTVNVINNNNKKILTWEDNFGLRKILKNVTLPEVQFLIFTVGNGMEAHVKLLLPPHMDKSGKIKYPLLVNVYAGPDSNQVFNRYKVSWETYFCLNNDVIIAYIDGRGSGLKGDDMLFANYKKLGSVEIEDQINVTRQIQEKFPFIDKKKIGIWGWSYGGYATGMALVSDIYKVFKCGASVAPVTDWIYYDSVYTERFMGLPTDKDNKIGYIASSLLTNASKLNKKFLLIHGTLDDNVHYQQSMMFARVLELNDILFQQQSYPDEVHSLSGVRHHFYHTLESFLLECFA
ncbi:hypothetical protein PGB90_009080 [Kerria lacca]